MPAAPCPPSSRVHSPWAQVSPWAASRSPETSQVPPVDLTVDTAPGWGRGVAPPPRSLGLSLAPHGPQTRAAVLDSALQRPLFSRDGGRAQRQHRKQLKAESGADWALDAWSQDSDPWDPHWRPRWFPQGGQLGCGPGLGPSVDIWGDGGRRQWRWREEQSGREEGGEEGEARRAGWSRSRLGPCRSEFFVGHAGVWDPSWLCTWVTPGGVCSRDRVGSRGPGARPASSRWALHFRLCSRSGPGHSPVYTIVPSTLVTAGDPAVLATGPPQDLPWGEHPRRYALGGLSGAAACLP